MDKDMNFELELKQSFREDELTLPEGLKKENVMKMLENDNYVPKKKKHIFAKILASVACLVIVVVSVYALPLIIPEKGLIEAETTGINKAVDEVKYKVIDNGLEETKLLQAESSDDLRNHFLRLYKADKLDDFVDDAFGMFYAKSENMAADGAINETMAVTSAQALAPGAAQNEVADDAMASGATGDSYGKTNTQVENVDEADIIKNDGKYIYILAGGAYKVERRVTILDAADMSVASRIELDNEGYSYNIQEMYVNGDRLILLANEWEVVEVEDDNSVIGYYSTADGPYYSYVDSEIVSFLYDISDRSNPTLIRKVNQDGHEYISSRMIDSVLYTVSSYVVRGEKESEIKDNAIPEVDGKEVPCDCIYIYDYDSERYVVLSAYDTSTDDGEVSSLSLLGSGNEVYCSQDALYVAGRNYDDANHTEFTEIYSFNLNGTDISYRASGSVKGTYLNQFSFDEYEENLRIATTFYSYKHDVDVSNVYVLDKDLQLIGQLEDIAYDEQVKSVRFMGDTAYLVTFRNTDPLFTLDMSDPTAPKVVGEVKLPGFSSYLHPVGEGYVVGLGYDGNEENADFNTVKVSLFDVSDLKNPKEVDTFVIKDCYSQALNNPKAFITYPEAKLIGFPVEHYAEGRVLSYKLLKIDGGEISNHLGYVHKTERMYGDVFRGTYIGDKLYTIDSYNVCEFDIATAEMLRYCQILNVEDDMPDYEKNGGYYYGVDYAVTTPAVPPGVVVTTMPPDVAATMATTMAVLPDYAQVPGDTTVAYTESTTIPFATDATIATTVATEGASFIGEVLEVYDGTLLVSVAELPTGGYSAVNVGDKVNVSLKIMDGKLLTGFSAGDKVKVEYDGMVMETFPAQISNVYMIVKV